MEKEFSPIECQKIMEVLTRKHNALCTTMYQHIKYKEVLIAEIVCIDSNDIKALDAMNISTSMFASHNKVELWMSKL